MIEPIDQVQKAYDALIRRRDQILIGAPPVTVRSKSRASSLVASGSSVHIPDKMRTLFLNSGEGSRLR
jgi:hypothetical protein